MPSPAPGNGGGDVGIDGGAQTWDGKGAPPRRRCIANGCIRYKAVKSDYCRTCFNEFPEDMKRALAPTPPAAQLDDEVQLFAFDATQDENVSEGRPKRKLKAIARFDSMTFDMTSGPCKIGEGFSCPRCSAACSYDSRECSECQLACYYEAGIGVVVLKEREVSVGRQSIAQHPTQNRAAAERSGSTGTLTMQKVTMQRKEKRKSPPQAKVDGQAKKGKKRHSSPAANLELCHPTDANDTHIPTQPAEGMPEGWVTRRIPRSKGNRKDMYWYSPKEGFKFRSKKQVQRFLEGLEDAEGDERKAIEPFLKYHVKRATPSSKSPKIGNEADLVADDEVGEEKVPAVESASSGEALAGSVAVSEGSEFIGFQHILDAAKLQSTKCDGEAVTIKHPNRKCKVSGCNRYKQPRCHGHCKIHFEMFGSPLGNGPDSDEQDDAPPLNLEAALLVPGKGAPPGRRCANVGCTKYKAPKSDGYCRTCYESYRDKALEGGVSTSVAAMPARPKFAEKSPSKLSVSSAMESVASPPPGNVSVRVQLYENELNPEDLTATPREGELERLRQQLKEATASNTSLSNLVASLRGTNDELANLVGEKDEALTEAKGTIAALRLDASEADKNGRASEEENELNRRLSELQSYYDALSSDASRREKELRDTIATLQASLQEKEEEARSSSQMSDLDHKLSAVMTERDGLAKKLEEATAKMSLMQAEVSNGSSKFEELQSEINAISKRDKETITALQAEKEDLSTKLQRMNATVGTLKLEHEVSQNKAETEISTLKQQASKRMSQVYELTDQLSTALTEKAEIETKLESTTENLARMQENSEAQSKKMTQLKPTVATPTAKSDTPSSTKATTPPTGEESKVEIVRLEAEKAEALAKCKSLTNQLSVQFIEKEELNQQVKTLTEDMSQVQEKAKRRKRRISHLESSIATLTANRAVTNSQMAAESTAEVSKEEVDRLKSERAESAAKTRRLESTVDDLQGQVERLSAELNASKASIQGLKSQVAAANAKCNTFESRHRETHNELMRVINERSRVSTDMVAEYKATINQQNEEMQALNEAVSASDSKNTDLIAQVSTLTAERDDLEAKVEDASKEVSQLQSALSLLKSQARASELSPKEHSAHSDEDLSNIYAEKDSLVAKINECIDRLGSKGGKMTSEVKEFKATVAKIRGDETGILWNMNEIVSRGEKLEQQLAEGDSEVSTLISDAEKLEARMKKNVQKFKDNCLLATKDCKTKLKQKRKKIQALKADVAKGNRALSSGDEDLRAPVPQSNTTDEESTKEVIDIEGEANADADAPKDDPEESSDVQLFAFDVTHEQYNWGRPKRKLKAIARFESMSFDSKKANCKIGEGFSCPRCSASCSYDSKECEECHLKCYYEAGIGVVVLKERKVDTARNTQLYHPSTQSASQQSPGPSKSVICRCADCGKRDMTIQGLTAHYAKEHRGKPRWQNVTYSCPFCRVSARKSQSLADVESHVNASHPGRRLLKPNTSKTAPHQRQGTKTAEKGMDDRVPPSWAWSKIEHTKLLPGGGKEYPRELPRAIGFIEAQCKNQEENVEIAQEKWAKSCKTDAQTEAKELEAEKALYRKGIRERSSLADQERLEKLRYSERADEIAMRIEYEGGAEEDVEEVKLCSRPIVFSNETEACGGACMNEDCQFCKKDSKYRHQVLLENEIDDCKLGAPAMSPPLIQKTTELLNPASSLLDEDHFVDAEEGDESRGDTSDDGPAERLRLEKDKLEKLKSTKHRLDFINKYNNGLVANAWAGAKKKSLSRKSSSI